MKHDDHTRNLLVRADVLAKQARFAEDAAQKVLDDSMAQVLELSVEQAAAHRYATGHAA